MQCFVFGSAQSGKSSLVRALARPAEGTPPPGKRGTQAKEEKQLQAGTVTAVLPVHTELSQGGEFCRSRPPPKYEIASTWLTGTTLLLLSSCGRDKG